MFNSICVKDDAEIDSKIICSSLFIWKKNFVIFVNILFNYCKYCNVQIPLATAKKKSINHSYRANLYVNNNLCK